MLRTARGALEIAVLQAAPLLGEGFSPEAKAVARSKTPGNIWSGGNEDLMGEVLGVEVCVEAVAEEECVCGGWGFRARLCWCHCDCMFDAICYCGRSVRRWFGGGVCQADGIVVVRKQGEGEDAFGVDIMGSKHHNKTAYGQR